jgi:hypothetical protein
MATVKKYNVPRDNAMADALDRQDGYGKYAPKKNEAISNKPMKSGGKVAKDGKWMQKVSKSIKARGTEGKCTPITKPGCTGRAKALAKTFKKIAAKRKGK